MVSAAQRLERIRSELILRRVQHWLLNVPIHPLQGALAPRDGLQVGHGSVLIPHELLQHGRISGDFHGLAQYVRIIQHVIYLRIAFHQLLHLRVRRHQRPHDLRVGHQTLGQRRVQELPEHVRIIEHFALQSLLHFHEIGAAHAQIGHAGQPAHPGQGERRRGGVGLLSRRRLLLIIGLLARTGRFDDQMDSHTVLDVVGLEPFFVFKDFPGENQAQLGDRSRFELGRNLLLELFDTRLKLVCISKLLM